MIDSPFCDNSLHHIHDRWLHINGLFKMLQKPIHCANSLQRGQFDDQCHWCSQDRGWEHSNYCQHCSQMPHEFNLEVCNDPNKRWYPYFNIRAVHGHHSARTVVRKCARRPNATIETWMNFFLWFTVGTILKCSVYFDFAYFTFVIPLQLNWSRCATWPYAAF